MVDRHLKSVMVAAAELAPIPGLLELLRVVDSRSLRKIAVTNAPPKNVELMLEAIGLSDYFEDVVFGAHCPRPKPFPDPYLLGLEKIGLTPDCTLVFEDSPAGTPNLLLLSRNRCCVACSTRSPVQINVCARVLLACVCSTTATVSVQVSKLALPQAFM